MRTIGQPQIFYEQPGVAGAGARVNSIVRGSENMDMPLPQFLLHVQTQYADHVHEKWINFCHELHTLGVIAGVIDGPTQEYQDAIKEAVGSYFSNLLNRSQRTNFWEGLSPLDGAATLGGIYYKAMGGVAGAFGPNRVSENWNAVGNRLLTTDPEKLLYNVGSDIVGTIWDSCKKRWYQFWDDFEKQGLLVAAGKLQIDAALVAAEIGISVAAAIVTGGVAGVALAGVKIVARRISATASRITVRLVGRAGQAVPDSNRIPVITRADTDLNPRIVREVFDEEKLGVGSGRGDVAARGELPNDSVNRPAGGAAGAGRTVQERVGPDGKKNTTELTFDPETGRPIGAQGTLRHDFGSTPRGDNATQVGKLGNAGDQGGHLVGHRFMGDTPDQGIAPQAGNLNNGAWRTMENEWADWTKKGYEVDYNINVRPPGAVRPDAFDVRYTVRDPQTGEIKYTNNNRFRNVPGQQFERVSFRDME